MLCCCLSQACLFTLAESHLLNIVTPAKNPFCFYIISVFISAVLLSSSSSCPNAAISPMLETHKIFLDIKSPLEKPPGFSAPLCRNVAFNSSSSHFLLNLPPLYLIASILVKPLLNHWDTRPQCWYNWCYFFFLILLDSAYYIWHSWSFPLFFLKHFLSFQYLSSTENLLLNLLNFPISKFGEPSNSINETLFLSILMIASRIITLNTICSQMQSIWISYLTSPCEHLDVNMSKTKCWNSNTHFS